MNDNPTRTKRPIDRRRFLADAARTACGVGIAGLGLVYLAEQAKALPASAIRPPGAGSEEDFLGACVRCGLCVNDCPYPTLKLSELGEDVPVGTPYFVARDYPCEMCDDVPCVQACPTGALDKRLTNIDDARMGLAVLVDQETCLNFLGLRCDVCYRVCPVIDKAITLESEANLRTGKHARFIPTVHSDHCTGCGKCERSCVLEEAAIKVFPGHLAKGSLGKHYRIGWREKEAKGEALVKGIIDLPDRLPGPVSGGGKP
ncbi:MAG: ferredoxin-type protein NapG [Rhodospirillaceae bacterium]|nr:ferredoxin-type protein NapG [Rhodospirillaceae bacterium]